VTIANSPRQRVSVVVTIAGGLQPWRGKMHFVMSAAVVAIVIHMTLIAM